MARTFLVGIGGSGAKAVESFIHLAAAGLGPDKVTVAIVDQDASNGNTNQALKTAQLYRELRARLRTPAQNHELPADCPFLRTDIDTPSQVGDMRWCPLPGDGMTLRRLYHYGSLRPHLKGLMDALYDPKTEQDMPLQRGFRGRPNVGAAVVVTQARADGNHAFWRYMADAIAAAKNNEQVRIFLVGSMFGGTGAAVFPTLAKLIRKLAIDAKVSDRVVVGGALLMPYFQFPGEREDDDGLAADASNFVAQAKSALHSYPELIEAGTLDTVYLFGWNHLIKVARRPSGGGDQINPPLLPDLFAGLAAAHFFAAPTISKGRILRADRGDAEVAGWADLPVPGDDPLAVQQKLGQLTRFAVAYLGSFAPTLSRKVKLPLFKESWYKNLVLAKGVELSDGAVQQLVGQANSYCEAMLGWIGGVVMATGGGGSAVSLVNAGLFAEWTPNAPSSVSVVITSDDERRKGFADLVVGGSGPDLGTIFNRLSEAHKDGATPLGGRGMGVFLGRLYAEANFSGYSDTDAGAPKVVLLPNVKSGAVTLVDRRRMWGDAGGVAVLTIIANALDVPPLTADNTGDAISVPDVWGQATLFASALQDDLHPLHKPLLGEWRGLIACLALTPEHLAMVGTQVVSTVALAAQPFEGMVPPEAIEHNFGQVLERMLPAASALGEAGWSNIGLIQIESAVVGMIVPSVLVCTGRQDVPAGTRIGWIKNGRFTDPCTMPEQSVGAEELATIAAYCRGLREQLVMVPASDLGLRTVLLDRLEQYASDATTAAARRGQGGMGAHFEPASVTLPTPPGLDMLRQAICRLAPDSVHLPSDLKLVLAKHAQPVAEPQEGPRKLAAVLLDDDWGANRKFASHRVWRTSAVESVLGNDTLLARVREEMAAAGVLLVTPDMLFTPVLCRVSSLLTSHPEPFRSFVLPFTQLAMTLFDIAPDSMSIRPNGKGFKVGLTLKVVDRRDVVQTVVVEREYAQAVEAELPEIFRWPNFVGQDWPRHFVYARQRSTHPLSVRNPVLPRQTLAACLGEHERHSRIGRLARLVTAASGVVDSYAGMSFHPANQGTLFNASTPAPAVVLDIATGRDGAGDGVLPAGIVLMPEPMAVGAQDRDWLVGIDFGTTNTSVYACEPGADPKPLPLVCRVESPYPKVDRAIVEDEHCEFMPSADLSIPFMTVMWVRTDQDAQNRNRPLYTYTLHNTVHPYSTLGMLSNFAANLRFDLKWKTRLAGERDGIGDFLRMVILDVLAEAVNAGIAPDRIQWRFSFPQAFHGRKLGSFRATTMDAVGDILSWLIPGADRMVPRWTNTGAVRSLHLDERKVADVSWASEGETSALYFADRMEVRLNGTVITLDIGGHTTDITIWQERSLVWRNSVELAGRHLFVDYLTRNLDKLAAFVRGDDSLVQAVETIGKADRQNKAAGVEVVINSPSFDPLIPSVTRDDHLKAFVEIALAGLLHYVGLVLANLSNRGKLEVRAGVPITLCLSGKVSKLLNAFPFLAEAPWVKDFLSDSSGGLVSQVLTRFSQDPKHEVAYGLVVTPDRDRIRGLTIDKADRGLILGESVRAVPPAGSAGQIHELSPTDIEDESSLPADWLWEMPERMAEFESFINRVCRHLRVTLKVGPHAMAQIRAEVEDALSQGRAERQAMNEAQIQADADSTVMAPPFIVAVVALLKRIASRDADVTFTH